MISPGTHVFISLHWAELPNWLVSMLAFLPWVVGTNAGQLLSSGPGKACPPALTLEIFLPI
jgi:hypothetical protein